MLVVAKATMYREEGRTLFLGFSFLDGVLMISSFWAWSCCMVFVGFLGLQPVGLSLVCQKFLASLVCLQLADMFQENLLVSEHITLHFKVQAVIHVVVNLLRFTVSSEKPAQNSQPPHLGYLLIGALAVPFPLPMPLCILFQWAKVSFQHRPWNGPSQSSRSSAHL